MLQILGIACILCIFVLTWYNANYIETLKGHKQAKTMLIVALATIIPSVLIGLHISTHFRVEENIAKTEYIKGVEQQWEYKIDTIWTRKK